MHCVHAYVILIGCCLIEINTFEGRESKKLRTVDLQEIHR
jgi:hypothetical protein